MFLSEWREFPSARCLAGEKNTWWQLASRCCWNHARLWHASELVFFLVGLRTYQHPGKLSQFFRIASSATVTTDVFIAAIIASRVKYYLRGLRGSHSTILHISRIVRVVLMWLGRQSEETLLCVREQSVSRGSSQSAVRLRWLRLCTVWVSHSQWPSEQISFITTMRLPILQLSYRLSFWQSITSPGSVSPPTAQIWLPATFGFSQRWNRRRKGDDLWMRQSHSTQAQSTASHCRLTSPTGWETVHGRTVSSLLTACHVTSRPRDRFSRYAKWLDTPDRPRNLLHSPKLHLPPPPKYEVSVFVA